MKDRVTAAIENLTPEQLREFMLSVMEVLYWVAPVDGGKGWDPEKEWHADTIEDVAAGLPRSVKDATEAEPEPCTTPIELQVAKIVVTEKTVQVPDTCPNCRANLREDGALTHWEYQDHSRPVNLDPDGSIDWGDYSYESGENDIPISWQCSGCGYVLADEKSITD